MATSPVTSGAMKSRRVRWRQVFLIGGGCALPVLVFAASLTWAVRLGDDSLALAIGALGVIVYGSGGVLALVSARRIVRGRRAADDAERARDATERSGPAEGWGR